MWDLSNQTRFKAERTFVRDADGAEIWLVAVRATFLIQPDGEVVVAKEQQEVCRAPEFFGDPAFSSLRYDTDLVRTKAGTDVILHATAFTPGGMPASYVDVGVEISGWVKQLKVFGARVWNKHRGDLVPSVPLPFAQLPIRYEYAWGGPLSDRDERNRANPTGFGVRAAEGYSVPNVESPWRPVSSARHAGPPAGFGPIACQWEPRLRLAGTFDENWQNSRKPLVPADFQDSYFRCAPLDQQFNGFLQGGEYVFLQNLTPEGALRFQLPRVALGFTTRIGGGITNHRAQLHTVIIEPTHRRLIMVWQTALPCHHTLYTLKGTTVFEKKRAFAGFGLSGTAEERLGLPR